MPKKYVLVEDLIDDDGFLDFYYKRKTPASREFEAWLRASQQNEILANEALELMQSIHLTETVENPQIQHARQRLFDSIEERGYQAAPVVRMKKKRIRAYWVAAASVLLIASAASWWLLAKEANQAINTEYGQIAESNLPDGSMVTLNANSTVTLSDGWNKDEDREVWLKGEAFFKVKKTATQQKFIVHTDQFDVIVTGTQFNVVNRTDKTAILLHEGSVTLQPKNGDPVYLKPGDYFEFTEAKNEIRKKEVKEGSILAWKDKKLMFDSTSLTELSLILNQHYGVNVVIADNALDETITGIVPNDNLDILIKTLEAMDFIIQRKGNDLIIAKL